MKENSVLQVLMYLFQNHMRDSCELHDVDTDLVGQLESAGFVLPAINQAIGWLANLTEDGGISHVSGPQESSFRVFNPQEIELLGEDGINYIISLEHQGILDANTREMVITQAIELEPEGIDLSLIKWVTLMVLFNQPGQEEALSNMELLVLEGSIGGIQ